MQLEEEALQYLLLEWVRLILHRLEQHIGIYYALAQNLLQLQRVAGGVNRRVFQIGLFSDLQTIINEVNTIILYTISMCGHMSLQVVNDTCIEIQSANPQTVCTGQSAASVELIGRGFTNTPNHTTIACRILVIGTNLSYSEWSTCNRQQSHNDEVCLQLRDQLSQSSITGLCVECRC